MQFWAIIIDSFRESKDRKIFWVMLLLSSVVAAAMFCVSFQPGRVDIMFGMWTIETSAFTSADGLRADRLAAVIIDGIMDHVLGFVGIVLSVIATANFIPNFVERGTVDLVLSKPIPRWRLLLYRYLGAMSFLGVQTAFFVVLTFLVAGVRWNVWLPGYLLSIPLIILLFSFLYCISALVGLITRSTITAILLTLLGWVIIAGVQSLDDMFVLYPDWQKSEAAYHTARTARWIVPKTSDMTRLAKRWGHATNFLFLVEPETTKDRELVQRAEKQEAQRAAMNPVVIIGSSLLFEVCVVLIAMFKFSRTDY
ncbi:MAG: ABC transporter permease [Planctomycetes bacterium]|nr:ABC transporter permease [Planctomycetota bacterium]MBI3833936.1 ABC transporter permease [Planctomycetota bacterium]